MIQNYEAKYAYSHVYISFIIRLQLASSLQMSNFSFKLGQISIDSHSFAETREDSSAIYFPEKYRHSFYCDTLGH